MLQNKHRVSAEQRVIIPISQADAKLLPACANVTPPNAAIPTPFEWKYTVDALWGSGICKIDVPKMPAFIQQMGVSLPPPVIFTGGKAREVRAAVEAVNWQQVDIHTVALWAAIDKSVATVCYAALSSFACLYACKTFCEWSGLVPHVQPLANTEANETALLRWGEWPIENQRLYAYFNGLVSVALAIVLYPLNFAILQEARQDDEAMIRVLDLNDKLSTLLSPDTIELSTDILRTEKEWLLDRAVRTGRCPLASSIAAKECLRTIDAATSQHEARMQAANLN